MLLFQTILKGVWQNFRNLLGGFLVNLETSKMKGYYACDLLNNSYTSTKPWTLWNLQPKDLGYGAKQSEHY